MTSNVTRIATDDPPVFAFSITGAVGKGDIEQLASIMKEALDRSEDVRTLPRFRPSRAGRVAAGSTPGPSRPSCIRWSMWKKSGVVGIPDAAQSLIDLMDNVIPVDTRAFDADEEERARAFVGAKPRH